MWILPYVLDLWAPYVPGPGSTNIELLPIVKATVGVGNDEDLIISFAAFESDGVTPLLLAGINWTLTITSMPHGPVKATLSSIGSNPAIVLSGASRNILTITDLAASKVWNYGVYSMRLLAADGYYTKEVFALSSITIGPPSPLVITPLRGEAPRGVLTPV